MGRGKRYDVVMLVNTAGNENVWIFVLKENYNLLSFLLLDVLLPCRSDVRDLGPARAHAAGYGQQDDTASQFLFYCGVDGGAALRYGRLWNP